MASGSSLGGLWKLWRASESHREASEKDLGWSGTGIRCLRLFSLPGHDLAAGFEPPVSLHTASTAWAACRFFAPLASRAQQAAVVAKLSTNVNYVLAGRLLGILSSF